MSKNLNRAIDIVEFLDDEEKLDLMGVLWDDLPTRLQEKFIEKHDLEHKEEQ